MAYKEYAVATDESAGSVRSTAETIRFFDVVIDKLPMGTEATEYVIRVNGRVIKRMALWQAQRMGLAE